jgi:chorismate lyase / 3-hydroxybenzoate synthase
MQLVVSSPYSPQKLTDAVDLHCLAQITFGLDAPPEKTQEVGQHIRSQLLVNTMPHYFEVWSSEQHVRHLDEDGMRLGCTDDLLFGVIEVSELDDASGYVCSLEQAAQHAYRQLFHTLEKYQYPYLWRAWNYVPDITLITNGVERYQQFNAGRQMGFSLAERSVTGNVPAACALGVKAGPLSVAFLAGRRATVAIENPRQISAYNYPAQYGLRSPTFSRGSLAYLHQQELLFISGTASIVGHETLHIGDVRGQTLETLRNLQAVIDQANLHSKGQSPYSLQELNMRVYVRHERDAALIKNLIDQRLGSSAKAIYIHADICRKNLDVEIECVAWQSLNLESDDLSKL